MNPTDEIAALRNELSLLRKETAALRKEMNTLHRYIHVQLDEDTDEVTGITISCLAVSFIHPTAPARMQMLFMATTDGPSVGLWDSSEKCRIFLGVEGDQPLITIRTAELKDAVLLRTDPAGGRGLVAVLDNGKPRALIRATDDDAGVISAVHDDGKPRVCIRSTGEHGEIFVTTHDSETAIKLTTNSLGGGGTLTVHGHGAKPAVILGTIAGYGGCIILNDPEGIPYITLPDPKTDHAEDAAEE